jgi:DNA-directed RNA polymerase II subunit RPB11
MALVYHNDIHPDSLVDLPEDTKLVEAKDPRGPNASDFTLQKEDHTVANIIRMKLHTNRRVKFAGYKVPHPTKHDVIIKVQTAAAAGDTKAAPAPSEVLDSCLGECIKETENFGMEFGRAFAEFEAQAAGN